MRGIDSPAESSSGGSGMEALEAIDYRTVADPLP